MKRGGLFFAAFLLISGMLRLSGPGAAVISPQGKETQNKPKEEDAGKNTPKIPYLQKFAGKINEFCGIPEISAGKDADLASYFQALRTSPNLCQGKTAQFVIALFPDPVHTRLGLSFDRRVEALQQAAQMKHWVFDSAVMPWSRPQRSEASDLKARREEEEEQAQRESYPGLMIFRRSEVPVAPATSSSDAKSPSTAVTTAKENAKEIAKATEGPLFVLVVGETPTAGLNKLQFRNALKMISQISGDLDSAGAVRPPLLILGPSFSGSLESLSGEMHHPDAQGVSTEIFVYSGTVTATDSMIWFQQHLASGSYFASLQENDEYARDEFLQFAFARGYQPYEVAILSEDETVFGAPGRIRGESHAGKKLNEKTDSSPSLDQNVVKLHFPREISYFRSAYQKEVAAPSSSSSNSSGNSTLPLNLDDSGGEDDTVAPYSVPQTSLSQEAVMLGIVSELQKHHIKFTLLLASDPLDQLFLAGYLRKAYPQGRVVVTAPDLLFAREGDPALGGVLGLSSYALIPGLSDRLCRQNDSIPWHEDRLFVSSLSAGTYNAMVGLLSVQEQKKEGWSPLLAVASTSSSGNVPAENSLSGLTAGTIPYAPYAEYGSPNLYISSSTGKGYCEERPLLWLTILGRDGFWPIVGLTNEGITSADGQMPIASGQGQGDALSTLETAADSRRLGQSYGLLSVSDTWETKLRTPPAWNIAYCLCLILLIVHAIFSWTGSILADSEDRAQFTRTNDCRGAVILALGAFALASAFVLAMCTRNPGVVWAGFPGLTFLLWMPYPIFVAVTAWDLGKLRGQLGVACVFLATACAMTVFQLLLTWIPFGPLRVYWSTRMLHITSGVSPVLPVLLIMAAAYWWMWMSLRGVCLVDLRRPRLPKKEDLPPESARISDTEGEELRKTAHPLYFIWQTVIPVLGLSGVSLLALGRDFPVQSVEGMAFDIGYTAILCLAVAAFLGCLMKLVQTWQKFHQVLAGLDRLPLRAAFGRMKDLSWHSFWNPGGSTLRETYKVMIHAMENLTRMLALVENWNTPMKESSRVLARDQIRKTFGAEADVVKTYSRILAREQKKINKRHPWYKKIQLWFRKDSGKGQRLDDLMSRVEALQNQMAGTGAILMKGLLKPLWEEEASPVVSTDPRIEKAPLPVYRAMAEEYVALVYVNFLVSVLLRIRTLVISAGGMYVFIVLSMNTYPFEPHLALQTLAVVLLLVMGGAVGFVYAEMHRETILSKLTSTEPGELGLDFWIKFVSAGAIPVFSLLAAQFPGINQFLFSWLEPALQAMK